MSIPQELKLLMTVVFICMGAILGIEMFSTQTGIFNAALESTLTLIALIGIALIVSLNFRAIKDESIPRNHFTKVKPLS